MFPKLPLIRLGMCRFSHPCTRKCTQLLPNKGANWHAISEDSLQLLSHASFLLGAAQ